MLFFFLPRLAAYLALHTVDLDAGKAVNAFVFFSRYERGFCFAPNLPPQLSNLLHYRNSRRRNRFAPEKK